MSLKKIREGVFVEEYLTSRIKKTPVLIAVTEAQYQTWKAMKIVAKAAVFTWREFPLWYGKGLEWYEKMKTQ